MHPWHNDEELETLEPLRLASKNERRYIMRDALGLYGKLIVSGFYSYTLTEEFDRFDGGDFYAYMPALKWCIAAHPILSAAIQGADTEAPKFVRQTSMDLMPHILFVNPSVRAFGYSLEEDLGVITDLCPENHDGQFDWVDRRPPWTVTIVPLPDGKSSPGKKRLYIVFAYSHSHGDGRSGLAFHRTFLQGLKRAHHVYDDERIFHPPSSPLPPPLEEACNLQITAPYLAQTLLGSYVPTFVSKWLNFQTPVAGSSTWTANPMSHDPAKFRTGCDVLFIESPLLNPVLQACREKGVKLTGLLNRLVVHALSETVPRYSRNHNSTYQDFIGQIVVDLRPIIPVYSENQMVNCGSALYESSARLQPPPGLSSKHDPELWKAARETTLRLAESASTLVDQPIGLLRYLSAFRPWFLNKLGKARESSYEISNAVVFDPLFPVPPVPASIADAAAFMEEKEDNMDWEIERVVLSQPANATSSPLHFSVVTIKGGDMVITLTWQRETLGVFDEPGFAKSILRKVNELLAEIGSDA